MTVISYWRDLRERARAVEKPTNWAKFWLLSIPWFLGIDAALHWLLNEPWRWSSATIAVAVIFIFEVIRDHRVRSRRTAEAEE